MMRPGLAMVRGARSRASIAVDAAAVLWWLCVVELGIRLAPLPLVSRWMGTPLETSAPEHRRVGAPVVGRREARLLRLLDTLGPRWPFCEGPCLRQALVAGHILRRHRPVLRIGATIGSAGVVGHAWLEVGELDVGRSEEFAVLLASPVP